MTQFRLFIYLIVLIPVLGFAHGDNAHGVKKPTSAASENKHSDNNQTSGPTSNSIEKEETEGTQGRQDASQTEPDVQISLSDFSFADFPTLHPLIVHLPVTLIPTALVILIIGLFLQSTQLYAVSAGLTVTGFISGIIAAFPMHPHTTGLSQAAYETLEKHDLFAYSTLALAGISSVFLLLICYKRFQLSVLKWLATVFLVLSSLTVAATGHFGGKLAYIHGIGSQGKYLER